MVLGCITGALVSPNSFAEIHRSGALLCTQTNSDPTTPCFRTEPLIYNNDELDEDQVVVYTTKTGSKYLERKTQRIETPKAWHNWGYWQRISLTGDLKDETVHSVLGFGGAFTDSASLLVTQLSSSQQDEFIRSYFSLSDGIGYSLARVPMASTDFSCRDQDKNPTLQNCSKDSKDYYTYADTPTEDLHDFALAKEDELKIPLIKKAIAQVGRTTDVELKLYSSPWSAPVWMKENHADYLKRPLDQVSLVHGKLQDSKKELWAEYFIKFFEAYLDHGIQFWGTTLQNEAARVGFGGAAEMQTWQTMYYTPQEEADFLKVLGKKMKSDKRFASIKLIAHDDQTSNLMERMHPLLEDSEAAKYLDGAGIHWYQNTVAKGMIENNYPRISEAVQILNTTNKLPDENKRFLLGTEACAGYMPNKWFINWFGGNHVGGPILGNSDRGEMYAQDIMQTLALGGSGWTDWNLALDLQGGPNWADNFVDAPILVDVPNQQYYLQPMFFYLGHFTKFVRPGAQVLETASWGPLGTEMEVIGFSVPAYQINLESRGSVKVPATTVMIVMNQDSLLGRSYRIDLPNGKFIYLDIEAKSIQTVVFKTQ
jgi:glucosylceramidase